MTVAALAKSIGKSRTAVSKTIHHGRYPEVLRLIKEELHVA